MKKYSSNYSFALIEHKESSVERKATKKSLVASKKEKKFSDLLNETRLVTVSQFGFISVSFLSCRFQQFFLFTRSITANFIPCSIYLSYIITRLVPFRRSLLFLILWYLYLPLLCNFNYAPYYLQNHIWPEERIINIEQK